jgi:hypothetical protein
MEIQRKIRSAAFRRGFVEGFASHMKFFEAYSIRSAEKNAATLDSAWKEVESALRESYRKESGIGKAYPKRPVREKQPA